MSFEWHPPTAHAVVTAEALRADTAAGASLFLEHGYLWVRGLLDPALVETLHDGWSAELGDKTEEDLAPGSLEVGKRRRMVTVDVKPPFTHPHVYAHPVLLPLIRQLLGKKCVLNSFGGVVAFPKSPPQHIHLDHPLLFEDRQVSASVPPYAITLVIPLIPLNEFTGTTGLFQGSHRDTQRNPADFKMQDAVQPHTALGDVYLMDYRLVHGGVGNKGGVPRPILYLAYARPWFSDAANFNWQPPLRVPPDGWDAIPREHHALFARAPGAAPPPPPRR